MEILECFLEQADIKLNLIRPSRLNPKLSAYVQLNGTFNYNRISEFIRVFKDLHKHLLTKVPKPAYTRLDNEASPLLQI